MQVTLNESHQIVLPESILQRLHIKPGDAVEIIVGDEGEIKLSPIANSITKLKGMLPKPKKTLSIQEMEEAIIKGVTRT